MKAMLKDKKANITVTYQEVVKLSNCDNEYLQFWILIQKYQNAKCDWEFKIETENEMELKWMKNFVHCCLLPCHSVNNYRILCKTVRSR